MMKWLTGSVSKYRWELVMIALSGAFVGGIIVNAAHRLLS